MEWLKYLIVQNNGCCILVNNWKQGKEYKKLTLSVLDYEYNYVNDKLHGTQTDWHELGCRSQELNYLNGKLHGIQRKWYNDESIWAIIHYNHGEPCGSITEWYANN
jgi:antitoxin component YwqK of YwqJK toxin-antitoxin module